MWRYKWFLFACLVISFALGSVYLKRVEPVYMIRARILVQEKGLPLDRREPRRRDMSFLATQAEIISSPAVVERAAPASEGTTFDGREEVSVGSILKSLKVTPVVGTNVLSVSYRDSNPSTATDRVKAIISGYQEYLRESERDTYLDTLQLLTRSEKELRDDLEKRQEEFLQLRKESPLMGQGRDATSVQWSLLTSLGRKVIETKARRIELEHQAPPLARSPGATKPHQFVSRKRQSDNSSSGEATFTLSTFDERIPQEAHAPIDLSTSELAMPPDLATAAFEACKDLGLIRRELFRAQAEHRALSRVYGHKHPEVLTSHERVSAWESCLREMIEAVPAVLDRQVDAVRRQETRLAALYQAECKKAKKHVCIEGSSTSCP